MADRPYALVAVTIAKSDLLGHLDIVPDLSNLFNASLTTFAIELDCSSLLIKIDDQLVGDRVALA